MPKEMKAGPTPTAHPSTFLSLLSGWAQQGVESFFATQRILVDLALRQNAAAMKTLREGLTDPENSPVSIMTELAVEGTSSFIEAQRILLNLAQQENHIVMNGLKERVGGYMPVMAMTDMVRRSVDTFINMQQEFLTITSKQTMNWLDAAKHGKGYDGSHLVELAREGMENFVHAQKKFLDVVAEETGHALNGKDHKMDKKGKKTELSELAREAANALIDAQKKLLDLAGQQMNVNLKAASRTMDMMTPSRFMPMANLTGEGVKSFVEAEKALIDSMMKPRTASKPAAKPMGAKKRVARGRKSHAAAAATAM